MNISKLVQESLTTIQASPVECLNGILKSICETVGCDYGLILTVDLQRDALLVDVLNGYAEEQAKAYRSERVKLPINESKSVAAKALIEARRQGRPILVMCSGEDPINFEIAPVEDTISCAVDSLGDYVSVLVLERKKGSAWPQFVDTPELRTLVHTCASLVSIALAARQSFVFKFDEFMKQEGCHDFESLSKGVVRWVFERFGVDVCSLYFIEYDPERGADYLVCKERIINGDSDGAAEKVRLAIGEDYAGWIVANNSSLISFADGGAEIHITSDTVTTDVGTKPTTRLHQIVPNSFFKSYLGVPIADGKHVVGVLEVLDTHREYSYSDQELLEMIANRIGSEYVRISRDIRRESLFDIPNIETRDLQLVIRGVVDAAMKVAAATHGLFMFKDQNGHFEPRAVRGYGLTKASIPKIEVGDHDLTNWVINNDSKPAFLCGDIAAGAELNPAIQPYINNSLAPRGFIPPNIRSLLMVPVYLKDSATDQTEDLGVLVLMSLRPNAFQQDEVVITALAEIVSYHIWGNKKTAELESTSEKVSLLEQAMPHYSRAATAAAASAGTVHTAKKHVVDVEKAITSLISHKKIKEDRDLLKLAEIIEKQFSEVTDLYDKLHRVFRGSDPTFESCDLAELVQEVRSYMDSKFKERHVVFKNLVTQANLPKVNLDPVLMKVVFINLINNSIDARAREITVSAQRTEIKNEVGDKQQVVEMTFKDNGSGIAAENVEKVFDLFFTADKKAGTGLGLAVNRDIMNKHGGSIQVAPSAPGKGTVFSLVWPVDLP